MKYLSVVLVLWCFASPARTRGMMPSTTTRAEKEREELSLCKLGDNKHSVCRILCALLPSFVSKIMVDEGNNKYCSHEFVLYHTVRVFGGLCGRWDKLKKSVIGENSYAKNNFPKNVLSWGRTCRPALPLDPFVVF